MAGSNNQATDAVAKAETTINKKIINICDKYCFTCVLKILFIRLIFSIIFRQ